MLRHNGGVTAIFADVNISGLFVPQNGQKHTFLGVVNNFFKKKLKKWNFVL